MQNFVAVSHRPNVCVRVGSPPFLWGPHPWDRGVVDALEIRYSPTCVIIPNFVTLGQTVLA